jgi:MFS family permease
MNEYSKNVKLDYLHTFFRNLNVTHGIWIMFLIFKGFSLIEVGIFESIFHITSVTMEVPTGVIADVYGRKLSRILGIFSYIIYLVIMILSSNVIIIAIGFIFCGLSFTLESGSGEAIVYDSLKLMNKEEEFIKFNGKKEVLYQLASSIALLIGGYIALVSFNLNFFIAIIGFVIALIIILMMKETPRDFGSKHYNFGKKMYEHFVVSTKTVYSNKRLLFLIVFSAMIAAPVTTLFLFQQENFLNLGYSKSTIGIFLALHSLLAIFGGFFADRLERKFKEKKILYFTPFFVTILFWLLMFDQYSFIPFILLGFFDSLLFVVMADYINKITPTPQRATVLSFNGFMFSLVMIIIFPLVGYIGEEYSLQFSFMILSVIITVFYLLLLVILSTNKNIQSSK